MTLSAYSECRGVRKSLHKQKGDERILECLITILSQLVDNQWIFDVRNSNSSIFTDAWWPTRGDTSNYFLNSVNALNNWGSGMTTPSSTFKWKTIFPNKRREKQPPSKMTRLLYPPSQTFWSNDSPTRLDYPLVDPFWQQVTTFTGKFHSLFIKKPILLNVQCRTESHSCAWESLSRYTNLDCRSSWDLWTRRTTEWPWFVHSSQSSMALT